MSAFASSGSYQLLMSESPSNTNTEKIDSDNLEFLLRLLLSISFGCSIFVVVNTTILYGKDLFLGPLDKISYHSKRTLTN